MRHLIIVVNITFADSNVGAEPQDISDEEGIIKRQEELAIAFYERMEQGQDFQETGAYRQKFFAKVIEKAEKVSFPLSMAFHGH